MAVSSYKTKKGMRWRFTITIREGVTKKRKDKARGGFETKRDAVLGEAEFRKLLEMNGDNGIDSTVDDIFKFYIEQRIKEGVKEQTIEGYKMRYDSTFREMIGKKKIRKINAMIMQQVMDELTPNYTSMNNHKSLINAVFKLAKSMGIITNNPIDIIVIEKNKLKKKKEDGEKFMNTEELKDFFESLNKKSTESKYLKDRKMLQEQALFTLLVLTGMRVGEALGLEWSDIDFENKKININKTQTVINGKSVISSTKTKQSDRTIPIESKYLIELLKEWKIKQKEVQIVYNCDNDILSNTVFYNVSRNKRYSNMTINRKIKEVCKFNDTKIITAHALRHTFVSLMVESETKKNKLSKYVGHVSKDKNMTDNYTHTGSEYLKEIAHRADKVISPLVK